VDKIVDFFSFGTNDLTQTVFGLLRDDARKFLPLDVEQGILPKDPLISIEVEGVDEMVRIATSAGGAGGVDGDRTA
jgi:pyruvate,orthophosphate dikinase